MYLNHKTLFIRPRNPTARAMLLYAVTNPEIHLWDQVATIYRFTHPEDHDAVPMPSLAEPMSGLTAADWKRVGEALIRASERSENDDRILNPGAAAAAAADEDVQPSSPPPHPAMRKRDPVNAPPKIHPAMLKQEPVDAPPKIHPAMLKRRPVEFLIKASPGSLKRRPVDVPVRHQCDGGANNLLRPRHF
jgi:hypothetical protein